MSDNSSGINRLARVLQVRMKDIGNTPGQIDFATVRHGGVIRLDSDELDIPISDLTRMKNSPTLSVGDRVVVAIIGDDVLLLGELED